MKKEFRKPFGRIFTSVDEIKSRLKGKKVIAVGDAVSYFLIKNKLPPDILVYDKKILRKPVNTEISQSIDNFRAKKFSVKNPSSTITNDLWKKVKESLVLSDRVKILVEGEEDLTVLPFVLESPEGTLILYGLGSGFVLLEVNNNLKKECKKLLSQMVAEEGARSSAR